MPRIRTIKPEFWSHPIIGRLPDDTQLLAIALLNFSDDEGYFSAEIHLVKSFCQPFREDYRSTTVAFQRLLEVGWIEVCEHPERGKIGRVINFKDHQVINKPTPSKLKTYWLPEYSRSATVVLPAGKERKGKELIIPKEPGSKKHPFENSQFFPFEKFRSALPDWSEDKCRHWFGRAEGYSKANGGRYLDWRQAVMNWERDKPFKEVNGKIPEGFTMIHGKLKKVIE